jgi:putative copper export protein
MSFQEIAVTIRAINQASNEFSRVQTDAQTLANRVKSLGSAIAGIGLAGVVVGYVSNQFGVLNDEQTKVFNSAMMVVSVMGIFMRTSAGLAVAQKIYSAATAIATAVQNSLNISFATFLALTGVGIAAIIAAAAAMYSFANSMNTATASVQNFNETAAETPQTTLSIRRTGDDELYRRGVE